MDRGDTLRDWCYLDFFLGTYDGKLLKDRKSSRGRPPNMRVPYREGSNREGRCRIVRNTDHDNVPYFPGQWFPKRNRGNGPPLFEASMLALLKPWLSIADLKTDGKSFKQSFEAFMNAASEQVKSVVENIQFYHECSESAKAKEINVDDDVADARGGCVDEETEQPLMDSDMNGPGENQFTQYVSEDTVQQLLDRPFSALEQLYANDAIEIGMDSGALGFATFETVYRKPAKPATSQELGLFAIWDEALKNSVVDSDRGELTSATLASVQERTTVHRRSGGVEAAIAPTSTDTVDIEEEKKVGLNEKQFMVYDIVTSHLTAFLRHENPPQRLLIVHGPGGTGKTAILNEISNAFERLGAGHLLAKTATSGVAASLIGGQTLHSWAALPTRKPPTDKWITNPSKEVALRRKKNLGALWLTIDEMSMLTTPLLAYLSQATGIVRTGISTVEPSLAFGGLNVILLGDFHQLPPVANTGHELYNAIQSDEICGLGRAYYEQFNAVIRLDEQMRIEDAEWDAILTRARTGDCTKSDIAELNKLILSNPMCDVPDFNATPWIDVVLVTPRNGCRVLWNEKKLDQHCRRMGYTHYVLYARDTTNDKTLSLQQQLIVAGLKVSDTNQLPNKVDMAIGMPVMVLMNIDTDSDLANGSRGVITDIFLDPREFVEPTVSGKVRLQYPPAAILFKPLYGRKKSLPGLPAGTIPIFPSRRSFSLKNVVEKVVIDREQFALTPAYAFTDYKAQGQTMETVIVDLAKPPLGCLTPFNMYVALSRGRGRSKIRLLRPFEEKLFSTHPSEQLRREDDRLDVLAQTTATRYRLGALTRHVPGADRESDSTVRVLTKTEGDIVTFDCVQIV